MDTLRTRAETLNYFQQSPVRGQLEPPDGTTGDRRFIQCTDIPNELKVLLPSKTSILYGNLLASELTELKKGSAASWDRIREIRRLKERMIRKCERLARASTADSNGTKPAGQMLLTVYAPPDFRMREMEKWLKHQTVGQLERGYSCCSKCGPLGPPGVLPASIKENLKLTQENLKLRERNGQHEKTGRLERQDSLKPHHHHERPRTTTVVATRTLIKGEPQEGIGLARSHSSPAAPRVVPPTHPHPPPPAAGMTRRPSTRAPNPPKPSPLAHAAEPTPKHAPPPPAQIPKRPATYTLVDPGVQVPRYYVGKHGEQHQISRVSRTRPDRVAHSVPLTPKQPEMQPKMVPPPAAERILLEQQQREKMRARSRSRSRSPASFQRVSAEECARALMQSPDPLPIPYRPRTPASNSHPSNVHQGEGGRGGYGGHEAERGGHTGAVFGISSIGSGAEETGTAPPPPLAAHAQEREAQAHHEELVIPRTTSPQSTLIDAPGSNTRQQDASGSPPPTKGMPLETIPERPGEREHEDVAARHPLLRRRSSLKKKGSVHSLASQVKSVTWAMDREWAEHAARFGRVVDEAEGAANELEQRRAQYHEEVAMMRIVCQDVVRAAERLGLTTDELKHESDELAKQQHKVATVSETIEHQEARFKDSVMNVLEETKQIVYLCNKKHSEVRDD